METLPLSEVIATLGVSRTVIYRLIAEGRLTPRGNPLRLRQSPGLRFPREQVEALRREVEAALREEVPA